MNELLDFAARLIELEGGIVEASPDAISAVVPQTLCQAWGSSEELALSASVDAPVRFGYGSELLERMLQTATATLPVARLQLDVEPPRPTQVLRAAEQWSLRNGVVEVGAVRTAQQQRAWLDALATLHGDERRELMVSSAIAFSTATIVEGFGAAASALSAARELGPPVPEHVLDAALSACTQLAECAAAGFRAAMSRRFERDHERIEHYFSDLSAELDKRARRGKLEPNALAEKRQAMLADRAAKLAALSARFVLKIDIQPVALRLVSAKGVCVGLRLRRRKANREIELEYDTATRRLVPVACEACRGPATRPAACDEALHLLCEACVPRSEGRIACAACLRATRASRKPSAGPAAGINTAAAPAMGNTSQARSLE